MAELNGNFGDREILDDMLASQKDITGLYNNCANECASNALQNEFMTLLGEEHQLQMEIFTEMQKRGWYNTQQAPQDKIQQARERFSGGDS